MAANPKVSVEFDATGLDKVRGGLRLVNDAANTTSRQWGMASRQIAGGLEQIARSGKVTGESLKQIVSQGAEMAFMFGAGGPIVAAMGIVGVAIYEHITNNIKAAREEAEKTANSIRAMVDAGDKAGIYKQMSSVYRGTPGQNFEDGIASLESQAATLEARRLKIDPNNFGRDHKGFASESQRALAAEIARVNGLLTAQKNLFLQLRMAYNAPMPWQGTGEIPGMTSSASAPGGATSSKSTSALVNRYLIGAPGGPGRFLNEILGSKSSLHGQDPLNVAIHGKGRPQDSAMTVAMVEGMKLAGEIAGNGFVDTLASSIEAGMARVFQKGANIGSVFAAIGQTALSGLGSIAVAIGRQFLTTFKFIDVMVTALKRLTPAIGVGAAIGLIAFGSAMQGAGNRMGANAGGFGGGGYGGGYSASAGYGSTVIDRGIIDPTRGAGVAARSANNYNVTIIGPNDPVAQRAIQELIYNAERRGRV